MFGTLKVWRASAAARGSWFLEKAKTPHARWWLAAYSFFEALILPFPTDPFLGVMAYADRARAVWLTILATVSSLAGGVVGYFIAFFFYNALAAPLVQYLGVGDQVAQLSHTLGHYAFTAVFLGAFTPIPYTPVVLAAGLLHANFFAFVIASLIGRGARYALVTTITLFFGTAVLPRLGKWATLITILLCALAAFILFILFIVSH